MPADVRSSRLTWAGMRTMVSRTTCPTRAMWLSISSSQWGWVSVGTREILSGSIPSLG